MLSIYSFLIFLSTMPQIALSFNGNFENECESHDECPANSFCTIRTLGFAYQIKYQYCKPCIQNMECTNVTGVGGCCPTQCQGDKFPCEGNSKLTPKVSTRPSTGNCSKARYETECPINGCFWKGVTCYTSHDQIRCSDYTEKDECDNSSYCEWDLHTFKPYGLCQDTSNGHQNISTMMLFNATLLSTILPPENKQNTTYNDSRPSNTTASLVAWEKFDSKCVSYGNMDWGDRYCKFVGINESSCNQIKMCKWVQKVSRPHSTTNLPATSTDDLYRSLVTDTSTSLEVHSTTNLPATSTDEPIYHPRSTSSYFTTSTNEPGAPLFEPGIPSFSMSSTVDKHKNHSSDSTVRILLICFLGILSFIFMGVLILQHVKSKRVAVQANNRTSDGSPIVIWNPARHNEFENPIYEDSYDKVV